MTEKLNELLEKAKTDKRVMLALKTAAVKASCFDLASELRQLETSLFPETEEIKKAKEIGRLNRISLGMVGINTDDANAWLISETMRYSSKMKGKFDTDTASKLKWDMHQLFADNFHKE